MAEQFNFVVIGGGSGGYVLAFWTAQLGFNVKMEATDILGEAINI